jgi:hypothetical protein
MVLISCWVGACSAPAWATGKTEAPNPAPKLDYLRDIRPMLAANCFTCHGQDEKKRQAGLRLDVPEGAYAKSGSGQPAAVPGKPQASGIYLRIVKSGGGKMPPDGTGKRLSAAEIGVLKRWIQEGARYAPHWAFQPPKRAPQPAVRNKTWPRNPIDRFVLARLEQEGLAPSPEADRYTQIRRLSLDLIGLPPTPAEVQAFVADRSPESYGRTVDRLLASPHFGEKWARKWLDIARYADSAGYGSDPLRPNLWPYRDWLINALNRNLPYDRFVIEQVAGDLLPNPTSEQLIATAFHRNTMTNTEGGTDREEFRTAAVKDRAVTTAQAFMGLTMGCAQCHSHKFDPITNNEFYRFVAFFNQTEDNDQPDEKPTMPLLPELQQARLAELKREIASLEATTPVTAEVKAQIDARKKQADAIKPVNLPITRELPKDKQRQSHVLILGNFLLKSDSVDPGLPAAFPKMPAGAPVNRLGVAEWIVSRDNPLTARVAVNRLWAQLFGTGLVETEEDFGLQGALPSHPELLDWLAVDFMERGWDVKAAIRQVVKSATYRQAARVESRALAKDTRNRFLWRYPRRRLDAEGVRDQALALSGLLSRELGGPSVYPPQPDGLWQAAFNGQRTYPTSTGSDRYRRGLYTFWRRTVPHPSMATFDAPSREICTLRRFPTNTPLQALVTLNDPAYLEMAQALGRRIVKEGGTTTEARIRYALQLALARPPGKEQVIPLLDLYAQETARYKADPASAKKLATEPLGPLPAGAEPAEMAAWTVVANVLLNMDAVLTQR